MKFPWSTERIYCSDTTELANLLGWLEQQSLNFAGKTEWQVVAITATSVASNYPLRWALEIKGFYVDVPSGYIQARRDKLEPSLAVADILRGDA